MSFDWDIFFPVLSVGVALVALQAFFAEADGHFSQPQMERQGITDRWSFLQHGGMWADVFIISPLVAYDAAKYTFDFTSRWGIGLGVATFVVVLALVEVYRRAGIIKSEAHTHDGKTTVAGWIHALYAGAAIFVYGQIYLGLTTPVVTRFDLILHTLILTPFFYLGAKKFSPEWKFDKGAKIQVFGGTLVVWILTLVRLYYA